MATHAGSVAVSVAARLTNAICAGSAWPDDKGNKPSCAHRSLTLVPKPFNLPISPDLSLHLLCARFTKRIKGKARPAPLFRAAPGHLARLCDGRRG